MRPPHSAGKGDPRAGGAKCLALSLLEKRRSNIRPRGNKEEKLKALSAARAFYDLLQGRKGAYSQEAIDLVIKKLSGSEDGADDRKIALAREGLPSVQQGLKEWLDKVTPEQWEAIGVQLTLMRQLSLWKIRTEESLLELLPEEDKALLSRTLREGNLALESAKVLMAHLRNKIKEKKLLSDIM